MSAVVEKIRDILTEEYSVENYVTLVNEVFGGLKVVAPTFLRKDFPTNFAAHIVGYSHVGNYISPDESKIVILSVELKKQTYVENSRSTQRSLAKKLIESANAAAALIAFYTPGDPRWRLSFVRLDYELKIENGKLKAAENLTPAKRYSFLVGKDEPCHTAIERFRLFLEKHNTCPTLDDLENAFSVEAVTKEFFELYCEKYHQLREALESNADFVEEAKLHNFTSAQFTKKLMGQIVFLYFLQKKGWLGVKAWPRQLNAADYKKAYYSRGATVYTQVDSDTYRINAAALSALSDEDETFLSTCVRGEPWGTGPHNFMRILFETSEKRGANFFDDFLEPLFYDALNVNRGEQGYDPALHCRIPFLSGGLFEPIDGYDWEHNRFAIPNELFSNKRDRKDRLADGILDIFDRYNFTMSEDEPLEREVAIDPEMLGKVFENLLDVNDRKSKGAFYTPREIVHYMCQESLINYLTTSMRVSEEAIRDFILYGDFMKDEDASVLKRAERGDSYELWISEELYQLNSDGTIKVDRMAELDRALKDVRVADPAVGSGAFPLGMLNEIVRARQNITTYMDITQKILDPKGANREIRYRRINERSAHQLKYDTIRNCIFAVDIEPSAVDIAQLRLWLALVIDDEIDPNALTALDGHRNPLPLPNLECNILCGNSLIDQFEGIKLINQSDLIGTAGEGMQTNLYQTAFEATLSRLIEKQDELFACDNTAKKAQILQYIDELRNSVIMSQIQDASPETLESYFETKTLASKPFILWQLDFARVFQEKGGFDIIIGNPPYIQLQSNKGAVGKLYEKCGYKIFFKMGDIYCLFMELGYNLLRNGGILSYINPNTWLQSISFSPARKFLTTNFAWLQVLITTKVFDSATVDTHCLTFCKSDTPRDCKVFRMDKEGKIIYLHTIPKEAVYRKEQAINIEANPSTTALVHKILNASTTVGAEMTVYNGVKPFAKGRGTPPQTEEIVKTHPYVVEGEKPSDEWLPLMRGSLMHRYINYWNNNYWILYGENLAEPRDPKIFSAPQKIIVRQTGDSIIAMIISENIICRNNLHICIPNSEKYNLEFVLGILNSKLTDFIYYFLNPEKGEALAEVKKAHVEMLPLPLVSNEQQYEISRIVEMIIEKKKQSNDTAYLEKEVDNHIYQLYGLSAEEIDIIEHYR